MSKDRTSRHRNAPTYRRAVGDREIELLEPRAIPLVVTTSRYRIEDGDRLDVIANAVGFTPFEYWRIADANPSDAVEELLEPGLELDIPEPD